MTAVWANAWALGWWLLALFVLLCWCVGSYRRFKRLRGQIRTTFGPVDAQLQHTLQWLHSLPAQAQVPAAAQAAFQALQPTADLLAGALSQVRANPLHAEALAQLDGIWQSLQAAWLAYVQTAARAAPLSSGEGEAPVSQVTPEAQEVQEVFVHSAHLLPGADVHTLWLVQTTTAWQEQHTVWRHRVEPFNQAVQAYNHALALPPGSWWGKLLGLRTARAFALPVPPL